MPSLLCANHENARQWAVRFFLFRVRGRAAWHRTGMWHTNARKWVGTCACCRSGTGGGGASRVPLFVSAWRDAWSDCASRPQMRNIPRAPRRSCEPCARRERRSSISTASNAAPPAPRNFLLLDHVKVVADAVDVVLVPLRCFGLHAVNRGCRQVLRPRWLSRGDQYGCGTTMYYVEKQESMRWGEAPNTVYCVG